MLLASELSTNAVLHTASGNAELRIGQDGGTASILAVVSDEQPSDADRLTEPQMRLRPAMVLWPSRGQVTSRWWWYPPRTGSGWRSWSQPSQPHGGVAMLPTAPPRARSLRLARMVPAWMRPDSAACSATCLMMLALLSQSRGRWQLDVRPRVQRQLALLPEKIAAAAAEFITGPLLDNPRRVGHPLRDEYSGSIPLGEVLTGACDLCAARECPARECPARGGRPGQSRGCGHRGCVAAGTACLRLRAC